MGTTTYKGRDYNFGQAMLNLRTKIGLTQVGLANELGISRRAVGEWETGSSYPKSQHLKALIVLAIQERAFTAGQEGEEICALWQAARQKLFLDERWLSSLLSQQRFSHPHLAPQAVEESTTLETCKNCGLSLSTCVCSSVESLPAPGPRVDWGEALAIPTFYGREEELAKLTQWIVQERCRVVSVLGMGGIGKSALAGSLMYEQAEHFEVVIFRSLRDAPALEALLDDCLQVLSPQALSTLPTSLEKRISLLLSLLRTQRALVVLDNLESLLEAGDTQGHFRPGFEGYGQLLRLVGETGHQSCLLFTSREKPTILRHLERETSLVRSLPLAGLSLAACKQILEEKGMVSGFTRGVGSQEDAESLIEVYAGNPLALKIVAETIIDLFGGEIGPFLGSGAALFGGINELLAEHFVRLSMVEQRVLSWLAIMREPVTLEGLRALLVTPLPHRQSLLEAVDALRRRSLLELGKRSGSFTLQSVVLEYVTGVLITGGSREIQQGRLDGLIQYGFSQATAREYVRKSQERLLVAPLLAELQHTYPGQGEIEQQLLNLLDELREQNDYAQGYGPANLIALLRIQRGHLKGLDLSKLSIRSAYLQGIKMQDTKLSGTMLRDTVFTEAFDIIRTVAVSCDGKLWAAGSVQGKIRVWDEGAQTLHLSLSAHTDSVYSLAFSQDGQTLASGSSDGTVKLWDLSQGVLLWMGRHTNIVCSIAFAPDGSMLASGGLDAVVRLWDVTSGTNRETLSGQGSGVSGLAWSPDGRLLAFSCLDGNIRLSHFQGTQSSPLATIDAAHTNWVTALAFAPNGRQLASGSWDSMVKLWDIASRHLCQTLRHFERVSAVAWSGDGRVVASACYDNTICIFDAEQGSNRAVLHGHTAIVYSVAFTSDSNGLLSCSEDGTMRVWDVTSGQCVRVIEGCAVSLQDVAWSPDSTRLASVDTDALVTIWDVTSGAQPKVLRGHSWHLFGVVWSPDGRLLASSGRDNAIRLWDPVTGECHQVLQDPDYIDTMFYGVAWSPDGHLLASGSYLRGVQVWDMGTRTRCWVGPHPTRIRCVAWSPDGTRLASCSDDGSVYLWKASDGTLLERLQGHSGRVMSVDWSPDGTQLTSGGSGRGGGELFVWDGKTGELVQTLKGHPGSVFAVVWSPTGKVLVSGGSDGTIRWWDVLTGVCLRICEGHEGAVQSLKISTDGRWLVSSGDDSAIRIWDVESAELLRTLRRDRPYERLNITGIKGLNEAQKASLQALGAFEEAVSRDCAS